MGNNTIYKFIKSPCGQAKYQELSNNKTFYGQLRLYWFIIFASLRDMNFKD